MPFTGTCTTEEKIPVTLRATYKTSSGAVKDAKLDGPIVVTKQSGDGSANMTGDMSFEAVSGDAPGETVFLIEGDADLGAGVVTISDTYTLTVTGVNADALDAVSGAPVPK